MNNLLISKGNERAVTIMNNGIYLHILAVGSLKTFFLKQTTKWSYFWAVKNDGKGVRPDLNSKRLSRHAQSCSICLIFFLRKITLVAMEPNVRDEITSVNRVPATNICVSRALHLNLQKKKLFGWTCSIQK